MLKESTYFYYKAKDIQFAFDAILSNVDDTKFIERTREEIYISKNNLVFYKEHVPYHLFQKFLLVKNCVVKIDEHYKEERYDMAKKEVKN
ncbi:hypothetical protein [Shouchella shacheensis]|uniref:hypothetical protein n=1 Tax=Shouchella shacheensis TaxID=1649580 RepID=UPI00073FFDDD|nr:hypothetical protein [Shouchella shacheensis]